MNTEKLKFIQGKIHLIGIFTIALTLFAINAKSQSCTSPTNNPPFNESFKCMYDTMSGFGDTWGERIQDYDDYTGGQAAMKKRYRSVFVNQSINRVGGFAVVDSNSSGTKYYFDPNDVGSTFGIDEDNDCVYERENELLDFLVDNHFDEIILYNVSGILKDGDQTAKDYDVNNNNPFTPYDNIMKEEKKLEWHLARFIYKAKNDYNLKVVGAVPGLTKPQYYGRFYSYYDEYSRNWYDDYTEMIEGFNEAFIDSYEDTWLNNPEDLKYLDYGEDTLFLPKDSQGRISYIDKVIVDAYNLHLFEFRVKNGFITNATGEECNEIGEGENICDNAFDGHLFEWEWWNNNVVADDKHEQELDKLLGLIEFSAKLKELVEPCYPEHYVTQDNFSDNGWTGLYRTEQRRADLVDSIAHRIYLYSYHKNPCDCYWGRANNPNSTYNDFNYKVNLLKNNDFGNPLPYGESFILPVFMAKYHDQSLLNDPNRPVYYGDGNMGCDNVQDSCDYCSERTGRALLDLQNNGYQPYLSYVENIFQEQYDFDTATHAGNSDSHIFGYCWFKSRLLQDNSFISSDGKTLTDKGNNIKVYPNPSNGLYNIESNKMITGIKIYDLRGSLIKQDQLSERRKQLRLKNSGVYLMQIEDIDGNITTKKVVKW
ncbi:T9SS type A sorting domain-containing protein [Salibacter halophilus]|uniref:T9SS type A sorting domain-containing protein n=1 Tax=Salibacter halophilus TaxID=1803916 RepID=A0A6N6M916_9FLAO|nr:T9SS type A sorting domain-containing protein [Salibacter halophilus]KAB1064692.1 T9SS type A sorting domain-containing protein [Salibacter halophilus]